MNNKLNILHLEDNLLDSGLIRNLLSRFDLMSSYRCVDNRQDFIDSFAEELPDIFISDINLPEFSGFDALEWITKEYPLIPIVIVTGSIDEETAAKTIQLGAWDYVVKERLHRLPPAIKNVLKLKEEREKSWQAGRMADNILQTTPSAVFTVDNEGIITSWNKMAETITGYSAEDIIGQSCKILGSTTCGEPCELFSTDRSGGPMLNNDCDLLTKGGVRKSILKNADLLYNEKGEVIGGIESFIDQSEKIKMTEELVFAKEKAEESDRLKSAFLANISHEIRTPLNAIIGFTDLVIDPDTEEKDKQDFTNIIKTGCDQLLSILGNVLQISLIEANQISLDLQKFKLDSLMQELMVIWQSKTNKEELQIIMVKSQSVDITSDRSRLALVLNNLIDNANKFTHKGEISFGYRMNSPNILFYVSDTGKGIPKSVNSKVFDRFYRVNDSAHVTRGAGLGLPISKAIINALGGSIWHEPNGEQGTTFFFEIPVNSKLVNS